MIQTSKHLNIFNPTNLASHMLKFGESLQRNHLTIDNLKPSFMLGESRVNVVMIGRGAYFMDHIKRRKKKLMHVIVNNVNLQLMSMNMYAYC